MPKIISATSGGRTLIDAVNEAFQNWIEHPTDTYFLSGSINHYE
ncbi:tryptophan synthase beta subunit [Capnocytophaga sp. oral taxon 338 str. F0234]|nr:tryptophan synthase beta subunit [Capnocytophaga sp. oral taxon 338 str. F0234]